MDAPHLPSDSLLAREAEASITKAIVLSVTLVMGSAAVCFCWLSRSGSGEVVDISLRSALVVGLQA